jgi:hypothetical protein
MVASCSNAVKDTETGRAGNTISSEEVEEEAEEEVDEAEEDAEADVFEVDAEVAEVVEDGVAVELGDEVEAGSG